MPDTRDLCTVDDVKALMQKAGPNSSGQDALIQSLITRASVKIMRDTHREFVPGGPNGETASNATRTFEFPRDHIGETFIDFDPYDLQTSPAPTLIVDTNLSSPLMLASTEWLLWPQPTRTGVYMGVRVSLLSARGGTPRFNNRQMTVQGNWGFPSVPADVTQACVETVVHWITANPAARRLEQIDAGMPGVNPRALPMSAVDLLAEFARKTM